MGQTTRDVLKSYLELGDKPTQAQFATFIDSVFNLTEDELPISKVTNLQQILDVLNAIQTPSGLEKVMTLDKTGWKLIGETEDIKDGYVHLENLFIKGRIWIEGYGNSVFIGADAGKYDDLSSKANINIGGNAGKYNMSGKLNTLIGYLAGEHLVSSDRNTIVGATAMAHLTAGNRNTSLGESAGQYYLADDTKKLLTSDDSIFIGYFSSPISNGKTNVIVIGNEAVGKESNTATVGNSNLTDFYAGQNGQAVVYAGNINFSNLPTSDPAVAGLCWNDAGTLKISAG